MLLLAILSVSEAGIFTMETRSQSGVEKFLSQDAHTDACEGIAR